MRKFRTVAAPLVALALVASACGGDDDGDDVADDEPAAEEPADEPADEVDATQGGDLTFHMITHSDDGPFWSVVKRGMDAACEDVGATCVWMPGVNDPGQMVTDIETAIS